MHVLLVLEKHYGLGLGVALFSGCCSFCPVLLLSPMCFVVRCRYLDLGLMVAGLALLLLLLLQLTFWQLWIDIEG